MNIYVLCESQKFFLNFITGSHHKSIDLVKNSIVDAAAIDSSVLQYWLKEHPEDEENLHTLCSIGPLPVQPIVVNSRMPGILHVYTIGHFTPVRWTDGSVSVM